MQTKRIMAIFMAVLLFSANVFAVGPNLNLRRGTALSVRLVSDVTNKKKGVTLSAMVENEVYGKNGKLVIQRGTLILLQVDKKKARGCGKSGYVSVKCVSTSTVDGKVIALEGIVSDEANPKKGLVLGLV